MNLRFENLKKTYAEKTVLDCSFAEVSGGKITGVIGPNGAGKTTLLNIIAGLGTASAGRVLYKVKAKNSIETFIDKVPHRKVTLLFQQAYMIRTSVEKNIAYPLKLRKLPDADISVRVNGLMTDLGLSDFAKTKATKLSGGEMQKVALARALSFNPRLLLLDEPTSNIDNIATSDIELMLKKTNSIDGTTILIISHNLAQIKRLCDDVIFMHQGQIVEQGPVLQVLSTPHDPRTRAFIEGELLI